MEENTRETTSARKFWIGAGAGFLTAVLIFACGWEVWHLVSYRQTGDFTSENISKSDVEQKLDQLNGLIESYYLYEDEIDEDVLIDGIYS